MRTPFRSLSDRGGILINNRIEETFKEYLVFTFLLLHRAKTYLLL